jgi:signal transduction histidine kinase
MSDQVEHALDVMAGGIDDQPRWRERQVNALAELALRGLKQPDLEHVLSFATDRLRVALDCDFTKILDARVSATGLQVRTGSGWPEGIIGEREVPEGMASQAGYTLEVGTPVIVDDMLRETRFQVAPLLLEHGIRSGISVVIVGDPDPHGVLQADSRTTSRFTLADIPIVQAYANVLSIIIEQRQRERMAAEFASIAAHELRTPLTLLMGYSGRLLKRLDEHGSIDSEQREEVETVFSETLRLRRAVDMYLALGEIERRSISPEMTEVDLVETVDAAVLEVAKRYSGAVIAVEPRLPELRWITDDIAVQRIISNLIENGVKYSPPRSTVTVELERHDGDGDRGPVTTVRVRDRCGGLPDDVMRRIFQIGFRGEDSGSGRGLGLGLYVGYRLAQRIGGSLTVANEGDGCVFTLRLPMVPVDTSL